MAHNLLNYLDVAFVFAKARTEGVPQIVDRKGAKRHRPPSLLGSGGCLLSVIGCANPPNGIVDAARGTEVVFARCENKACIAFHLHCTSSILKLSVLFLQQRLLYLLKHRDSAPAAGTLGGGDVKGIAFSMERLVKKGMVNADGAFFEVAILPAQEGPLSLEESARKR